MKAVIIKNVILDSNHKTEEESIKGFNTKIYTLLLKFIEVKVILRIKKRDARKKT